MNIRCIVACYNASGGPAFFFVNVECTEEQYDAGENPHRVFAQTKRCEEMYTDNGFYAKNLLIITTLDADQQRIDNMVTELNQTQSPKVSVRRVELTMCNTCRPTVTA